MQHTHLDRDGNPERVHYFIWSAAFKSGHIAVLNRGEHFPTADVGKATRFIVAKFHPDVQDELRVIIRHSTETCGTCQTNGRRN